MVTINGDLALDTDLFNMSVSGGHLKVTPEELKVASQQVSVGVNKIKALFESLERISKASASFWNGDAADKFRSTYSKFKSETDTMVARISEHVVDLEMMAGVYTKTENEVQEVAAALPDDIIS